MKKTPSKFRSVFFMILGGLVIAICVVGVIGIWVIGSQLISISTVALEEIDSTTQVVRNNISLLDQSLMGMEESVESVEAAAQQLSENLMDKGLILTLLPAAKEEELSAKSESVREELARVRDFLISTRNVVNSVNQLPFISLPGSGLASSENLNDQRDELIDLVDQLSNDIEAFRTGASERVSRITTAATTTKNVLTRFRTEVASIDSDLEGIQTTSNRLQTTLPVVLTISFIVITLLSAWVVYTQVVVFGQSLHQFRQAKQGAVGDED